MQLTRSRTMKLLPKREKHKETSYERTTESFMDTNQTDWSWTNIYTASDGLRYTKEEIQTHEKLKIALKSLIE